MKDWYVFLLGEKLWAMEVLHRDKDGFMAMIDLVKPDLACACAFKKEADALQYASEMFADYKPNPRKKMV